MATAKSKKHPDAAPAGVGQVLTGDGPVVSLAALLSKKTIYQNFSIWIIGDTPLITHAWSQKAKTEILQKQVGATRGAREKRDPEADFRSSLYTIADGVYGFPVTAFKESILSVAHKDKGIARTAVMSALWMNAQMVRVGPALAGAICDMPLIRLYATDPEMREDSVKIGSGLNKIAGLAYRAQFTKWAVRIDGRFNPEVLKPEAFAFLVQEAGIAQGVGEWRIGKGGVFGGFHLADEAEEQAWNNYASGKGPIPGYEPVLMAAE